MKVFAGKSAVEPTLNLYPYNLGFTDKPVQITGNFDLMKQSKMILEQEITRGEVKRLSLVDDHLLILYGICI